MANKSIGSDEPSSVVQTVDNNGTRSIPSPGTARGTITPFSIQSILGLAAQSNSNVGSNISDQSRTVSYQPTSEPQHHQINYSLDQTTAMAGLLSSYFVAQRSLLTNQNANDMTGCVSLSPLNHPAIYLDEQFKSYLSGSTFTGGTPSIQELLLAVGNSNEAAQHPLRSTDSSGLPPNPIADFLNSFATNSASSQIQMAQAYAQRWAAATAALAVMSRQRSRRTVVRRAVFTEDQRRRLERTFQRSKYISRSERKKLADDLFLKESQNRRMKWRSSAQSATSMIGSLALPNTNDGIHNALSATTCTERTGFPKDLIQSGRHLNEPGAGGTVSIEAGELTEDSSFEGISDCETVTPVVSGPVNLALLK